MIDLANKEIRETAKRSGVRLWQVAHYMGVTDATFSRKLRFELSADEREKILDIIAGLSGKKVEAS